MEERVPQIQLPLQNELTGIGPELRPVGGAGIFAATATAAVAAGRAGQQRVHCRFDGTESLDGHDVVQELAHPILHIRHTPAGNNKHNLQCSPIRAHTHTHTHTHTHPPPFPRHPSHRNPVLGGGVDIVGRDLRQNGGAKGGVE